MELHIAAKQLKPKQLKNIGVTILICFKFKKMKTKKMSLANMQGKLTRAQMKNIMAGSGDGWNGPCGPPCSAQGPNCQCYFTGSGYNDAYRCHCS